VPNPTPRPHPDWDRIANTDAFRSLLKAKAGFIIPATVFFLAYYFLLPVLVGYAPEFMSRPILGPLNGAYLFALSQFVMAWAVAWLYMRAAAGFDRRAAQILKDAGEDSPR
jgi:uncharacterized membrane protein (DUF485 family)